MPALFNREALCFQYPENWTLEVEEETDERQTVTVYAPGGGFWTVIGRQGPDQESPAQLARSALATMREEYKDLDSEAVQEQVEGVELEGYDLHFFCLDLTNTALVRAGRTDSVAYLIVCQAEDREFEQIEQVFRAMTTSLLRGEQVRT